MVRVTNNPNSYGSNQPDPSGFNHPEGYSDYNSYGTDANGSTDPAYGGYAYGGGAYGQYDANATQPAPVKNNLPMASLIVALVAGLFVILFFPLGFILAIVALVLGILGIRRTKQIQAQGGDTGSQKTLSIVGIVLSVLILVALTVLTVIGVRIGQEIIDSGIVDACQQYQDDPEKFQECLLDEMEKNPNLPSVR